MESHHWVGLGALAVLISGCSAGTGDEAAVEGRVASADTNPFATDGFYDVGVIPEDWNACPEANRVEIHMDDENNGNGSFVNWSTGATVSDHDTTLRFCRVDGRGFRPKWIFTNEDVMYGTRWVKTWDYLVLRLGDSCPNGGHTIWRRFDNQDSSKNGNWVSGQIWPGSQDKDTVLAFCYYRAGDPDGSSVPFPNLGISYEVFADLYFDGIGAWWFASQRQRCQYPSVDDAIKNAKAAARTHEKGRADSVVTSPPNCLREAWELYPGAYPGMIFTDDEDTGNSNKAWTEEAGVAWPSNIISAGKDTMMFVRGAPAGQVVHD